MFTVAPASGKDSYRGKWLFSLLLVGLLSAAAQAQVTYTGTAANQNFGSQAIGTTSSSTSFSFSIGAGTSVGSIGVLTLGAPNLDFNNASGSTCTATTYSSATNCNVNVTFKPPTAGTRSGAIVFFSGSGNTGNILGSVGIAGTGTGAQIALGPAVSSFTGGTIDGEEAFMESSPAVDGFGNVYAIGWLPSGNEDLYQILEFPANGGAQTTINPTVDGKLLNGASSIAIDGAGNLYVADYFNNRAVEIPTGGGTPFTLPLPNINPGVICVDPLGNIYVGDQTNKGLYELPAGSSTPIFRGTADEPFAIVADAAGNIYFGQGNLTMKIEPGQTDGVIWGTPLDATDGQNPYGALALDPEGNLFVLTSINNANLIEISSDGTSTVAIPNILVNGSDMVGAGGLSIDNYGNLFLSGIVSYPPDNLYALAKITRPKTAGFSFNSLTAVGAIDTTDGTKTVQIQNIGNQALNFTQVNYPADFSQASSDTNPCTVSTSLSNWQQCDIPIQFSPENAGVLSEAVTLTDNNLSVSGAQQSFAVSGTSQASAAMTSPAPGSTLTGANVTFTWSAVPGVTGYALWVGTTGAGSDDFYQGGVHNVTSLALSVPANGKALYVRLWTSNSGALSYRDYSYTEASTMIQAVMTYPTPGTVMYAGPNVGFGWSAGGSNATGYALWVGTTGVGSHNVLQGAIQNTLSAVASNIPTVSETVYVRLYTSFSGTLEYTDYTYTAENEAIMLTPTPGTRLTGSTVTFTWSLGASSSLGYSVDVGTNGPGTRNIMWGGLHNATSYTVSGIPTNGETVYVTLNTWVAFNSANYQSYTYTTGNNKAVMTSPTAGSTLPGSDVTFTWTPVSGDTGYALWIGNTGVGSDNLYEGGIHNVTSLTVNDLPANGSKLYVRLWASNNGVLVSNDYTYTEAASNIQGAITSPAPSSTLTGPSATFTWSAGSSNATGYALWVGTTGTGSSNIFQGGVHNVTSATVNGIPATNNLLYVRLWTSFSGTLEYTDYVFYEAATGAMASPSPGTTLTGASQTFTWLAGSSGATGYALWVGTTGVGSHDILEGGVHNNTSLTVNGLPTNGEPLYVRLYTSFNGVLSSADYVYTTE